jgi:SAM-dependent methyltransferase
VSTWSDLPRSSQIEQKERCDPLKSEKIPELSLGETMYCLMLCCPICKSSNVAVHQKGDDRDLDSRAFGSSRTTTSAGEILRCRDCDFGFRKNRYDESLLAEIYSQMDATVYEKELRGRRKTAEQHLSIVQKQLRGGTILDVGCASGLFLTEAVNAGWRVTGLEPAEVLFSQANARLGGQGKVICKTLEQADLAQDSFDAITLWDVLEHVSDPVATLIRCRTLLKANGFVFLNVPDLDSLQARILGKSWPLLLAEHLNYFNRPSLKLCAERAGLSLVRFGRRRVSFSLQYIGYRLAQHRVLGATLLSGMAQSRLGTLLIPVSLGETFAVFQAGSSGSLPEN